MFGSELGGNGPEYVYPVQLLVEMGQDIYPVQYLVEIRCVVNGLQRTIVYCCVSVEKHST